MKFVVLAFIASISTIGYSQITIKEMMNIHSMDMDHFETFAIKKGFTFDVIKEDENIFGSCYVKGKGTNTQYIELDSHFYNEGIRVKYQIHNTTTFLSIKNELNALGFKLIKTETFDGSISKTYSNNKWKITVYSGKDGDGDPWFEIDFYRL